MPAWEMMISWEDKTDQYMTARWLNRMVNNIHWANDFYRYGRTTFRAVTMRVFQNTSYETIWRGHYKHVNKDVIGVYTVYRTTTGVAVDNIQDGNGKARRVLADPAAAGARPGYLFASGSPTLAKFQIKISGVWTDLVLISTSTENTYSFTVDMTAQGLVVGTLYPVRMICQNGCIEVARIHGELSASYTWPTLPTTTDTTVLTYAQWNLFVQALNYCRQIATAPKAPTLGVYEKGGYNLDADFASVVWKANIRHKANKLVYGFAVHSEAALDAVGVTIGEVKLYYNGEYLSGATNTIYPPGSYSGGEVFSAGARIRPESPNTETPGTNPTSWRAIEGYIDLSTLVTPPVENTWYTIELRTFSTAATNYYPQIQYCFEVEGQPTNTLDSTRWAHANFVRGDSLTPQVTHWKNDLNNTIKALADAHIQVLAPDTESDRDTANGWPALYDKPNDYHGVRQLPILGWAGTSVLFEAGAHSLGTSTNGRAYLSALGNRLGVHYYVRSTQGTGDGVNYAIELLE